MILIFSRVYSCSTYAKRLRWWIWFFSWIFMNLYEFSHMFMNIQGWKFHFSEISCFLNMFRTFNAFCGLKTKYFGRKNWEFSKYDFSRKCGFLKFLRFINCFRKDSKMIKTLRFIFLVPDRVKINHCITWSEKNYLYHQLWIKLLGWSAF